MNLLILNAGSSSLKFRIFRITQLHSVSEQEQVLAEGFVERIGTNAASIQYRIREQTPVSIMVSAHDHTEAVELLLKLLINHDRSESLKIDCTGHRIVHGGARFYKPARIDSDLLKEIEALNELAPLHNRSGHAVIAACIASLPNIPAVAVFDTGFHHSLPSIASHYAIPSSLAKAHNLRRYGFHGISYKYVSEKLKEEAGAIPRLILCHLGSGASVCALQDGQSVDTSMGFTPMEGLMMGTRCGDIDPGLLLYLLNKDGISSEELDTILNHQSGLLGLSGISNDVRDIEMAAQSGNESALFALERFSYSIRKYIGAYSAALGGLDGIGFTGGIGEHSASVRRSVCTGLEYLGLKIDPEANDKADGSDLAAIHHSEGKVRIYVIPTDEERQIARETFALLHSADGLEGS